MTYEKAVNAWGGSGEILIAKPKEQYNLAKKPSGAYIIGTSLSSNLSLILADIITDNNIDDWITSALANELSAAGYKPKMVLELPGNVSKGINLTITKVFVKYDFSTGPSIPPATAVTKKAISEIKLIIEIWKNSEKVKGLSIDAKGVERIEPYHTLRWVSLSTLHMEGINYSAISLRKGLQSAMQQAIPEIIKTLEY